ncbi:glycosyltransferase family 4 protein [Sphingobacterium chuzhouense]|uniref:Glycosyltransferase family 4 protein n=1 Tax=Sphingobacterium chuzhouense TaxID=1742264 RepID=A0ABR7XXL1_9SPHI|nr:glycosyltransferase family 4 protein [Sphingobacterium chuzhouense]MBD1423771.1 glycosyltransferase family 4 protein [Sphingobacterium chuzhouense]
MKAAFIHDHNFVYNSVTDLYYDGSGGAFDEKLWRRYLELFDSLTVVGRKIEKLPNKLVVSSAENVNFKLIEGASGFKSVLKNKKKIQEELKTIIDVADFVIVRLPSTLGSWAFDICNTTNKKYVVEIVGDPFEAYWHHGSWIGKFIAPLEAIKLKKIVSKAQHVIYVTQEVLQKRYPCPNKTEAISNVRLEEVVNEGIVREFYGRESDIFRIGLIGSFHVQYKGHLEALKALKYLKDQGYSGIELSLVGTGDPSWVEDLARHYQVENQVNIIGALNAGKDGIMPFLDDMHIYMHPSKTEGLPRVIIEAMSRGKICLGSDVGGTRELLEEKYIHKPGSWELLAKQVEGILKCGTVEKIAIACRNLHVAEKYTEYVLQNRRAIFIKEIIDL